MASGRAAPWFCWRMVAATIRFPKTGASQRLGFAIQSERLRMTLGSLRTPKSTLGRCRYHIFRLTHMAYSDVFFGCFSWKSLGEWLAGIVPVGGRWDPPGSSRSQDPHGHVGSLRWSMGPQSGVHEWLGPMVLWMVAKSCTKRMEETL